MKYMAASILVLLQVSAFADQVSDMYKRFDRAQYDYSNCFKDNLCGDERFSIKASNGTDNKEKLFDAISSKCISPSVGFINATSLPLDSDTTYKINIESISRSTTLIMKCTPERSYNISISENPESCSKASTNNQVKNIFDVCNKALEPKTYESVTSCGGKKGYTLNSTTQKCERTCEKGKVLFSRFKPGIFIDCSGNGGNNYNSCSIYDQSGRLVEEKNYVKNQIPASYFEIACVSCADSNYFKDSNYTETKEDNLCYLAEENGGCERGRELISKIVSCNGNSELCPKNPEGTFRKTECIGKCYPYEQRGQNGKCLMSKKKSCEMIKEQLNYVLNWDYRSLFRNARFKGCTSRDIHTALALKITNTIQDLEKKSLACNRGEIQDPYSAIDKELQLNSWLMKANSTCLDNNIGSLYSPLDSLYGMPPNESKYTRWEDGWYNGW